MTYLDIISSLPCWRTSTPRRLPRPPISCSCIPAPCPEPPVWSREAITRREHQATVLPGYGPRRRHGARLWVDSIDCSPCSPDEALKRLIETQTSDNFYYWGEITAKKIKGQRGGGAEDSVIAPAPQHFILLRHCTKNRSPIALAWSILRLGSYR